MEILMVLGNISGKMGLPIRETLFGAFAKEKECGLTNREINTKVNSKKIKRMELAYLLGLMEIFIRESSKTT